MTKRAETLLVRGFMLLCGVSAAGGGGASLHSANTQHEHRALMAYKLGENTDRLKQLTTRVSNMESQLIRVSVQLSLDSRGTN